VTFAALFCFILVQVLPQFKGIFKTFGAELPVVTQVVMGLSDIMVDGGFWIVIGGISAIFLAVFVLLWMTGNDRSVAERFLLHMPLIGPVFRRNLIARWCDAVGLGVESGMDLPAAIAMADDAIGSNTLRGDGKAIVEAISSGQRVHQARAGKILPPLVIAGIELAATRNDLPQGLRSLSRLYEDQAELRLSAVEAILTPMLIVFMGLLVALMVMAVFAPLISLIQSVSSPMQFVSHH
jgi:type II secretory pathway component PulF